MSSTTNENRVSKSSHQFSYWYGRLLLIVAGFVVALIVVELMLRLLGIGYGTVHMFSSWLLHHEHPKNYQFVSYHRSGEYGGHSVFYDEWGRRADPDGIRDNTDKDNVSVAMMGDSFVEALQVSYGDSFVGRLRAAAAYLVLFLPAKRGQVGSESLLF